MADDDDEWTPSDSQLSESQASVAAPARRRLRKKAEAEAEACAPPLQPPPCADEPESVLPELDDESEPLPAPLTCLQEAPPITTTSPTIGPTGSPLRAQPAESSTPAAASPALTPSRLDWARGLAAAAGASLLGSMLRRFSLSPLPAAPAASAEPVASPPLEEPVHDAAPVRRRRLRKKRSLEASSQLPSDSPDDDAADALADALAGVTLARPAAAPAAPPPSPPAPPTQAAEAVRSSASLSSDDSSDDSSSSCDDDDDDDDLPRPAPRPAPRTSQHAAGVTASDGPLVTGCDDEAAAEGAQLQRLEFTDAASGARCVCSRAVCVVHLA